MNRAIELAKKLKALADRGIGGEKINAEKMLNDFIKKHNIKLEDIEKEDINDYFFKIDENNLLLFRLIRQITTKVSKEIKKYLFNKKTIRQYKLSGNYMISCTLYEYIEIKNTFDIMSKLFEKELEVFYTSFLYANDLLIEPDADSDISKYSEEEIEQFNRAVKMSNNIKKATILKQLES